MSIRRFLFSTLSFLLAAAALRAAPALADGRRPSDIPDGETASMVRVIDGDTIEVSVGGNARVVKLLGVNAPGSGECLGTRATAFTRDLLYVNLVRLERDATHANAAGQLLRYVYRLDGPMLNEELLKAGLARAEVVRPDIKHAPEFAALEQQAYAARRGVWGACGGARPKPAYSPTVCATFSVEELISRVPRLAEQTLLKDGDCVNIVKASNPGGPAWGGRYVYHPAGSRVALGNVYVRWKDGFVRIVKGPDGRLIADMEEVQATRLVIPSTPGGRPFIVPASVRRFTAELERDAGNPAIVRIPNNAWLFREVGAGQFVALVDVFEYVSGAMNTPFVNENGFVP